MSITISDLASLLLDLTAVGEHRKLFLEMKELDPIRFDEFVAEVNNVYEED